MSRLSGKCDFLDFLDGYSDEYVEKSNIYIYDEDDNLKLLNVKTINDCTPYFTHIVGSAASSKESGTIHLTRHSWLRLERNRYGIMIAHSHYRQAINEEMIKNGFEPLYSNEECKKNFWSKFDGIGNLYLVANIYKDYQNDLHICKDDNHNLYLIKTVEKLKDKYIITPLDKTLFLDMLNSKTNIEETIKNAPISYITHYDIEKDALIGVQRKSSGLGKKYFKKANFYCKDKCDEKIIEFAKKEINT